MNIGYSQLSNLKRLEEWSVTSQEFSIGKITLDIIEAEEGTIYSNSITQREEGVAELIFEVDNLHQELELLRNKEIETLVISKDKKMASIDSRGKGNLLVRLVEK